MAYQQRPNSGTLFLNDKGNNSARPDYRGDCEVNGQLMEISAWIKSGRKGDFLSLSFKPKQERQSEPRQSAPSSPAPDTGAPDEDDVPFNHPPRTFNPMRLA